MKKIFILIVFVSLFSISGKVSAQLYEPPLGSIYNPIQLQVIETPQSFIQSLKNTYRVSAYNDCSMYLMDSISCSIKYDHSGNQMLCPRAIQNCLENPSVKATYEKNFMDEICQKKFAGTYYNNSLNKCSCLIGYQWNNERTACVVSTYIKSTVPGCIGNAPFSPDSGLSCDGTNKCSTGMQLNSDKTECILIPVKENIVKQVEPKKDIQINSETSSVPILDIQPIPPKKLSWWRRIINYLFK
jgi:hypothetical protein